MLEKECIQSRGFKNLVIDKEVVGFQFNIRLMYYRGIWLSQLRFLSLLVDGKKINPANIRWTISGETYSLEEMEKIGNIQWNVLDVATITVFQQKSLSVGYHNLEIDYNFSSSYMPPNMDEVLSFGLHSRRLLLVS